MPNSSSNSTKNGDGNNNQKDIRAGYQNLGDLLNLGQALSGIPKQPFSPGGGGLPLMQLQSLLNGTQALSADNTCYNDLGIWFTALAKSEWWAMQMLDAWGKPGRNLLKGNVHFYGNYDECKEISHKFSTNHLFYGKLEREIKGRYCGVSLPASILKQFGLTQIAQYGMSIHVCIPESCKMEDIGKALGVEGICLEDKDIRDDPSGIAGVVILSIIVGVALICTAYDVIYDMCNTCDKENHENNSKAKANGVNGVNGEVLNLQVGSNFILKPNIGNTGPEVAVESFENKTDEQRDVENTTNPKPQQTKTRKKKDGLCRRLMLSFSIWRNARKILDTSTSGGDLGCLHGIRVLSMGWVILGHTIIFCLSRLENALDAYKLINTFAFQAIINATLSVDTFFVMGGCLVAYLFLKETKKAGGVKCKQMILYYVHRYWRLTPFYMLIVMINTCIVKYIVSGPFNFFPNPDEENCREYAWVNLLYINNVYDMEKLCLGVSWYLSNDMQFYIISPLALVPLAYGWWFVGLPVIGALMVCHLVSNAILQHEIGGGNIFVNQEKYSPKIYFKPYTRVGVYAIGLLLGYILHKTKFKYRMRPWLVIVGWIFAVVMALTVIYTTYDEHHDGAKPWTEAQLASHETLYRPGWALAVSWVIFACCNGYGGIVNHILSWRAWIPLARLTYGAYLLHMIVMNVITRNYRIPMFFSTLTTSLEFIQFFVLAYAVSFVLSTLMEAPFVALEKILFRR